VEWKLIKEQPVSAERVQEAYHLLFKDQEPVEETINMYSKSIVN